MPLIDMLISKELQAGDFGAHARRSPNSVGAAATSLLFGLNPAASLVVGGIGRGIDSNQQSLAADRSLQARGIWGTGAGGKDRTTSGWKDFFGYDAREQEQDIIDEVKKKIKAAKSFDPADDGSYFDSMTTTPGLATPVSMTVDANMQDSSGGSFFSPTAVNTASNAFYNRGGFGSNAASLVQPRGQPMGQQYGPQVSYPDGPNAPVTTYDQRVDLGPDARTLGREQVQEAIDTSWGDDTGGTWGAEGNWGGYGDWGDDAY